LSQPESRSAIAIIGGGIVGVATAYHIAKGGAKDVLLLERGEPSVGPKSACQTVLGVRLHAGAWRPLARRAVRRRDGSNLQHAERVAPIRAGR
jgi:glycine/D-amino acid oxidase-like deaminating enzyme